MNATRHRQRAGHGRRWLIGSAIATVLVAVGLTAFLSGSSLPAHRTADAQPVTATSAVSKKVLIPTEAKTTAAAPATTRTTTAATTTSPVAHPSTIANTTAASTAAPLAGLIQPGVSYHGVATNYAAGDGDGACSFGPAATMMIAAMNYTDYDNSKACGAYVLVHAGDGASITVLITNECPAPCAPGQLDLSQQAFAKLANLSAGEIPIKIGRAHV